MDFAILNKQIVRLLLENFAGTLKKLTLGILCRALHRQAHHHHRATRAGGNVVRSNIGIELGNRYLI
jgi:hypothetical protein